MNSSVNPRQNTIALKSCKTDKHMDKLIYIPIMYTLNIRLLGVCNEIVTKIAYIAKLNFLCRLLNTSFTSIERESDQPVIVFARLSS